MQNIVVSSAANAFIWAIVWSISSCVVSPASMKASTAQLEAEIKELRQSNNQLEDSNNQLDIANKRLTDEKTAMSATQQPQTVTLYANKGKDTDKILLLINEEFLSGEGFKAGRN
ncbi:hypothetical protein [Nostoc sp. CALU 1950]|uniref:hypothetical protein n=1 Tax=Nostoc sp. CALU 1950 TaxID=3104321 RepID=UPI003EBC05F4